MFVCNSHDGLYITSNTECFGRRVAILKICDSFVSGDAETEMVDASAERNHSRAISILVAVVANNI